MRDRPVSRGDLWRQTLKRIDEGIREGRRNCPDASSLKRV
jgi:hypothetical protein